MNRDDDSQFNAVADQFVNELREGLNPQVSDFIKAHPELAERIGRLFPVLQLMEKSDGDERKRESDLLAKEMEQLKDVPPLRQLGDYRIIREIGRGGMGVVYEAEQESLGRHVALKVLPDSIQFDARRRQRFQQEARAAAMLHHTNIIPVFGIGHADQLSYFVMQYIDGQPLDSVLREISDLSGGNWEQWTIHTDNVHGNLSTVASGLMSNHDDNKEGRNSSSTKASASDNESKDRSATRSASHSLSHDRLSGYWRNVARIGQQVASALSHAHSHGVVHRDIKPSNLLMDSTGAVWVTDFGLAKFLESPDLTRTGEFVGTLRYMSPEHLQAKTDERSDIFCLGLTLHELSTMKPFFDASDRNELLRQVGTGVGKAVRSVNRNVPKDLATIIGKCLAVEPTQRYGSAEALELDLKRFLAGEPILARNTPVVERIFKWCQRRPAIATLLAALVLSINIGFAAVSWQWQKTAAALKLAEDNLIKANEQAAVARTHFEQAREAVNQFFTIVGRQRLLREPGLQPLRKELLEQALDYHKKFAAQYRNDDNLKSDLASSLYFVVEIESQISANASQHEAVDEPLKLFQELADEATDNETYPIWISRCQSLKGRLISRIDTQAYLDLMEQSVKTIEDARVRFANETLGAEDLAKQYQGLGLIWETAGLANGETEKSLVFYSKALAEREALQKEFPDDLPQTIFIASIKRDLGVTYRRRGDFELAEEYYNSALEILNQVVSEHPENELANLTLASVSNTVGYYYGTGAPVKDYPRALECYQISAQQYEQLAGKNPLVNEFQDGLARAYQNSGQIYLAIGDFENALDLQQRAEKIRRKLAADFPTATHFVSSWALSLNGVGSVLRDLDRIDESLDWHRRAHEVHVRAVEQDPLATIYRLRLITGIVQQARALCAANQFVEGVTVLKTIPDYALEDYSAPYFELGRELVLVAVKISRLSDDEKTPELNDLYEQCLADSREALTEAARRGENIVRSWKVDGTLHLFSDTPECMEIEAWLPNVEVGD
ncbi:MAG: serine/threonine-protein kinase [Pirellulaceae bacterium]